MIAFLKKRISRPDAPLALGHLEGTVMQIVWDRGESNVREVSEQMTRPLAYTTVMTTLDRLFKKGLLDRRKADRAFLYSPRLTQPEWEQRRAGHLLADLLAGPQPPSDILISCLIEAVGEQDDKLLDELERKIRIKRKELSQRRKS